jgi:hypothetical protein
MIIFEVFEFNCAYFEGIRVIWKRTWFGLVECNCAHWRILKVILAEDGLI